MTAQDDVLPRERANQRHRRGAGGTFEQSRPVDDVEAKMRGKGTNRLATAQGAATQDGLDWFGPKDIDQCRGLLDAMIIEWAVVVSGIGIVARSRGCVANDEESHEPGTVAKSVRPLNCGGAG